MDFKEYLLTQTDFNLSALAYRMWPNHKTAPTYLSAKLREKGGRTFTKEDEKAARKALEQLGISLTKIAKSKS